MSADSTTTYTCDLCGVEDHGWRFGGGPKGDWLTIRHDPESSSGHLCDACREDVAEALGMGVVERTVSTPALVEVDAFWCERDQVAMKDQQCETYLPPHRRLYYKDFGRGMES